MGYSLSIHGLYLAGSCVIPSSFFLGKDYLVLIKRQFPNVFEYFSNTEFNLITERNIIKRSFSLYGITPVQLYHVKLWVSSLWGAL